MPKILFVNNTLSGGTGSYLVTLAKALSQRGVSVELLIYEDRIEYPLPDEITLHRFNPLPRPDLLPALQKYILSSDADLIFSNSTPTHRLLRQIDDPRIHLIVHSSEEKHYEGLGASLRKAWRRNKYRKLYHRQKLVTVSRGLERYILCDLQAKPLHTQSIYNPFDFDEIAAKAETPLLEESLPDEPYLLFVGRLDIAHKGLDTLILSYLKSDVSLPLYLLGEGPDRAEVYDLIKGLGLEKRVRLLGYRSNPYPWIKQARLLILSSNYEGFGRVLVEALALKTPVVSTRCPYGPSEILTGELQSFLTPVAQPKPLAHTIRSALESYPTIHASYYEKFRDDKIADQFLSLLQAERSR